MIINKNVLNQNNKLEFVIKMVMDARLNNILPYWKSPISEGEKANFFASLFGKYNNLELYRMICVANELIILESK
jgi:hypothetical protein